MVPENKTPDKGPEGNANVNGSPENSKPLSPEDVGNLKKDPELTALIARMRDNVKGAGSASQDQAIQVPDVATKNNEGQQK